MSCQLKNVYVYQVEGLCQFFMHILMFIKVKELYTSRQYTKGVMFVKVKWLYELSVQKGLMFIKVKGLYELSVRKR